MQIVDKETLDIIAESQFRAKFPNVSFPRVLSDKLLAPYKHAVLVEKPMPEPAGNKVVVRAKKAKYNSNNNTYEIEWQVLDAPATPSADTLEQARARALDALELAYQTALDSYDYSYSYTQPIAPMAVAASENATGVKSTDALTIEPRKYAMPFRWGLRDIDISLFGVNFVAAKDSTLTENTVGIPLYTTVSAYNRWNEEAYIAADAKGLAAYQGLLNARKAMDKERATIAASIAKAATAEAVDAITIAISDPQA